MLSHVHGCACHLRDPGLHTFPATALESTNLRLYSADLPQSHPLHLPRAMAFKRPRASSPAPPQKRTRGPSKYISLGTELPEEDGDDGAFVPVWKQTVTDERGRRRLHGAFTGGFSAG
jgi:hypothetical protein